ncbi:hypothetical protein AA12717_1447 [Gluconacetobacter sacchari DSM 12717]|uniref:Uncharacterized protein n=2 Tax=Gluconacetobacter sacchari TaxID=92759 RepID=A0A7W4IE26_9PROT|nr:hypothetical protein [Gluconacetobacter sacchari]MBB2161154.1 hypothetical protein [Gluconacetobacter sacchari]GBQ23292.1 hypothetical protein AA12717_1447 [Gluconacetobacter sacchari DSM 12717]
MLGGLGRLLAAFGTSGIDVYEWAQTDVQKVRLPNGPNWGNLAHPRPKLQFNGWKLAHAVTKADYLVERDLLLPGLGFLLQIDHIIDFSAGANLRLVPGSAATLNDFTRTSLSGRVGQGLSLLFAQSKGYHFVCHLASDVNVVSHMSSLTKKLKAADFLFEDNRGARMILESKASFSQPTNDPTLIKSILKAALTSQVDYWMTRLTPPASKGFALYSCLRETGNAIPSALIFVDPPEQPTHQPVDIPQDQVRRRNYAAWLTAMGLTETARALLQPSRDGRRAIELPLFQIGPRQFAVAVQSYSHDGERWLGMGLDVSVLNAISAALGGEDGPLLAYERLFTDGLDMAMAEIESGSIFPDGSYFGELNIDAQLTGFQSFLL